MLSNKTQQTATVQSPHDNDARWLRNLSTSTNPNENCKHLLGK